MVSFSLPWKSQYAESKAGLALLCLEYSWVPWEALHTRDLSTSSSAISSSLYSSLLALFSHFSLFLWTHQQGPVFSCGVLGLNKASIFFQQSIIDIDTKKGGKKRKVISSSSIYLAKTPALIFLYVLALKTRISSRISSWWLPCCNTPWEI